MDLVSALLSTTPTLQSALQTVLDLQSTVPGEAPLLLVPEQHVHTATHVSFQIKAVPTLSAKVLALVLLPRLRVSEALVQVSVLDRNLGVK